MARIVLIHGAATEAERRGETLRRAGHDVTVVQPSRETDPSRLLERPPDAFVIDMRRAPAQGRDFGLWLRSRKATRGIPLVFVGGEGDKIAATRKLLPDATYTDWRRIRGAVRSALEQPPSRPVAPGTLAGYSGTPLPKKLGIKPGSTVALVGAPKGFEPTLGTLPADVTLRRQSRGKNNVVILFVKSRRDLERRLPTAERALAEKGALWIVWPKKSSGVATDATATVVRGTGLGAGLVDYKVAAIDSTWSGLCFARRSSGK